MLTTLSIVVFNRDTAYAYNEGDAMRGYAIIEKAATQAIALARAGHRMVTRLNGIWAAVGVRV